MAKQQACQKFIYKLPSKRIRQAKWNLSLPLATAMKNANDIVALSDSQILRWICELNGANDLDPKVSRLREEIEAVRQQPFSAKNRETIKKLYEKLYSLQYQKDYLCVVMDSNKDYDAANNGFQVNGCKYRRLLGTNGGIKKSTITYISEHVFAEIKKRMDNGRDASKPIIPAKLEAYQALICSASIPVTEPRILIVPDCYVTFRENVLTIRDDCEGEPVLTREQDYEIHYCDSDGYGLMSPDYSRAINRDLYGDAYEGRTITGVNTRYAWTKGMLFTFDFVEFAKQKNKGCYIVSDAWGTERDVRDYDVILTTSMVKLWDSYESLEHFVKCCQENHYQFSVSKTTPHELEHMRNLNYQFLQTYDLTDGELRELCQPTIDEIKDVLGCDWRKTIVFAKGTRLNADAVDKLDDDFIKALMIDRRLIDDPFILKKIHKMIQKKINMAAKGSIQITGNFAMVSGDPYSLAQSIFGLPVTGLLRKGEVYHRYWIEKGVDEIAVFRAPMTCHNNIRRRNVVHNEEMDFWYQYITTGIILNSWDTTCDATNGSDKDGDMFFTTDHEIIVKHTLNSTTIECMQKKAAPTIPSESDLIQANKLAFGDKIGTTTNRITAMIERQAAFDKKSEEYRVLDYRIKCGQHYQQTSIDKAKGILAKPMPAYWYDKAACKKLPEETEEQKQFKAVSLRVVAEHKPYFMKYVYPDLMTEYNRYVRDTNSKCIRQFRMPVEELIRKPDKTLAEQEFITYYQTYMPVGTNPCTVNRVARLIEDAFPSFSYAGAQPGSFDHSILKSGAAYSKKQYQQIMGVKAEYDNSVKLFQQSAKKQRLDKDDVTLNHHMMKLSFRSQCEQICPNEKALCDILIDLCYSSPKSKQFVWDMCGTVIIQNLLEKNDFHINYPIRVKTGGDFRYGGESFMMCRKKLKESDENDYIK